MMITKEEVQAFFKEQAWDKIIEQHTAITEQTDNEMVHILGLAYINQKKFREAANTFLALAEKGGHAGAWFNIIGPAVADNNFELAEKAYQETQNMKAYGAKQNNMPPHMITYLYMCRLTEAGQYAAAFRLLNKLKTHYTAIFATGDNFVTSRGLPVLSDVIEYAKRIFTHMEDPQLVKNWFTEFKSGIDGDGKARLTALEKELKKGK